MHLFVGDLLEALRSKTSVQAFNINPSLIISGIEVLPYTFHPETDTLTDGIVYICEYRRLRRFDADMEFPPLICLIEPTNTADLSIFRGRQIIAVYDFTIPNLLSTLTDAVFNAASKTSDLTERTGMLTRCRSIDELMDAGYQLVQNPLILTDQSQKILQATSEDLIPSDIYRYIVAAEYVPLGRWHQDASPLENGINKEQIYEKGSADTNLPAVICTPLRSGEKTLGYLHALQFNRDFVREDREIIQLLSNLLAMELRRFSDLQPQSLEQKTIRLFRDIIDNIAGSPKEIMSTQQEIGLSFNHFLYTLAIFAKEISFSAHINYLDLANSISWMFPGCHSFLYRDGIIVILNVKDEILDMDSYLEPLLPLLKKHRLVAGISNPFSALHQLREYYLQSRKAIQLGSVIHKDKNVYQFSDYVITYIAETCLKSISLETLVPPSLIRLIMHDRDTGSELVKTLEIYLHCCRSKPQTAAAMFLHENTIRYRISQIQKIINLDIHDDETALKLMLAFKLLEYRDSFEAQSPEPK